MSVASSEQWRPIPGWEGAYEVSDQGRVRSLDRPRHPGRVLKWRLDKYGYPRVTLSQHHQAVTRFVHALVAAAFIGPRPSDLDVRHLDGNPMNARVANLAYGTRRENAADLQRYGMHHNVAKERCPKGHAYDEENTYVEPSRPNSRHCRACRNARVTARRLAARAVS